MEDPESLRVGLIGCGYQGRRLAQVIALTSSIEVKACADIDLEAAAKLASSIGHPTKHPSVDDLLENANVDVVMVATPHHVLADISLKAIEAGKHVLVEKPIGMIEQEAARIEEAVARKGVCFMSGYSLRYLPAWQKVKDLLAMGAIGEIQAMTGSFGIYPMNDGWLANPDTGGGPLLYIGSHLIDQVLWYIEDDPIEVYANIRYRHDTQADETTAFQINFARGGTAQLVVTQAADRFSHHLIIYGRAGQIIMNPCDFLDYEISVVSSILEEFEQPTILHPKEEGDLRDVMLLHQINNLTAAIREGRQPSAGVQDGRRVLQVMDAIFASDRANEPSTLIRSE